MKQVVAPLSSRAKEAFPTSSRRKSSNSIALRCDTWLEWHAEPPPPPPILFHYLFTFRPPSLFDLLTPSGARSHTPPPLPTIHGNSQAGHRRHEQPLTLRLKMPKVPIPVPPPLNHYPAILSGDKGADGCCRFCEVSVDFAEVQELLEVGQFLTADTFRRFVTHAFPNTFIRRHRARCGAEEESREIWVPCNIEVLRADEGEASAAMQGRGKREIPEKTRQPSESPGTIPTGENPEVAPPGIKPGSPRGEASSLTTTTP
ncbi:hypothetical protein PR048_002413 [Dryococelus australis]|uniref:Uncharacterized protein n=1 Tax=Dryococelus australis TaxID=614101 RepID=A0ABQ9IKU9_9NEOP|nr:hypothetical protein PR048_002413 [Dryococelus australis]